MGIQITRQYAEMISSVSAIGISGSMAQKLFQSLKLLRLQVEDVLLRLSAPLGGAVVRSVFLINNYDVVLTVVKQENRLSDEKSLLNDEITWFTRLLGTHTTVFIENELTTNFPEIVKFSRTPQQQQLLPATLDETIKSFNEHWKAGFQSISADVSKYFPNFDLGSDILRQTFGQFIVHYTTLENVVRSLQRTKEARSFIPLSTITYEIRNVKF